MKNEYNLFFDGACSGKNPGGLGSYGFYLELNNKPLTYGHGQIGQTRHMTEGVAEFYGLLSGLVRFISIIEAKAVLNIFGDSRLVIDQLTGKSKKTTNLQEQKIVELHLKTIRSLGISVNIKWIPRNQNSICDGLTKILRNNKNVNNN